MRCIIEGCAAGSGAAAGGAAALPRATCDVPVDGVPGCAEPARVVVPGARAVPAEAVTAEEVPAGAAAVAGRGVTLPGEATMISCGPEITASGRLTPTAREPQAAFCSRASGPLAIRTCVNLSCWPPSW
jgi:hypothetical protein